MPTLTALRHELRPMLRLALPLVLAEVGWMSMGLVDTVMVGHLPNAAVSLSAAALAQILFNTLVFGFGGILLGLDTTIAQAHGAGEIAAANRWLAQGLALTVALSVLLTGILLTSPLALGHLPTDPQVLAQAVPTLGALTWGVLPLLLYFTLRRYLQAFNHPRLVAAALVSANLVNLLFDWLFIFPHRFGWSGMGVKGSGIATSLARVYQAVFLMAAIAWVDRRHRYRLLATLRANLHPHWASLRRLLALGLPAGGTILVEILVFATVTAVIATLGPVPLAGNEIALNLISFTFMVPMGISAAASVRVGQALGRSSPAEARAAGWTAIGLSCCAMALSSAAYLLLPHALANLFTQEPQVIAATVPLLLLAAVFQFCDGLQVTAIGALRGAGDTHSGFVTHLCSYWLLGFPLGLSLCFRRGLGAPGLWVGLTAALVVSGLILVYRWARTPLTGTPR